MSNQCTTPERCPLSRLPAHRVARSRAHFFYYYYYYYDNDYYHYDDDCLNYYYHCYYSHNAA